MRLPPHVREAFQAHGRRGGRLRARRLDATERQRIARLAASRRWIEVRFGAPTFAALGLPGGARIDQGLLDLGAGRETPESLLVSLAAPRLLREGIPVPPTRFAEADMRLYRTLELEHGDLAHARYLALLEETSSFADACAMLRGG